MAMHSSPGAHYAEEVHAERKQPLPSMPSTRESDWQPSSHGPKYPQSAFVVHGSTHRAKVPISLPVQMHGSAQVFWLLKPMHDGSTSQDAPASSGGSPGCVEAESHCSPSLLRLISGVQTVPVPRMPCSLGTKRYMSATV